MQTRRAYSLGGLHLTEQFETCRLAAYLDCAGVPTIGWGHTRNVRLGDMCTQSQADVWLQEDILAAANCVNIAVHPDLTQPEFDALTDFVFNLGCHAFCESTLLHFLNLGDFEKAAGQFERWDYAAGKQCSGLLRRRRAELLEFREAAD